MALRGLHLSFSPMRVRLPELILIGAAVATLFLWPIPWTTTPDGVLHLQRTRALAEAFQAGIFYPRLFPDFAFGYGYPVFNYYAPLSYYPAALLHWWGAPLAPAVLIGLALFSALAGWAAYHFFRGWAAPSVAFVGALLYLLLPYRLYDLFSRGALPEFVAFTWLPIIGLGLHQLLQQTAASLSIRTLVQSKNFVLAVLGWSALILTHNLSALLVLMAIGLALPFFLLPAIWKGVGKRKRGLLRVLALGLPILLGAGLAAFYVLPALLEITWVGIGQGQNTAGYANHFATLPTLFTWSFPYPYPVAAAPTVPVTGAVVVVLFGLLLLCLDPRAGRLRPAALLVLFISTCVLLLLTSLSRPLWDVTALVMGKLLFPWRWQMILGFATVWGLALMLQWLRESYFQRSRTGFVVLLGALLTLLAFHALGDLPRADTAVTPALLTRNAMWEFDAAVGQIGTAWLGEFTPKWVQEQRWAISRAPTDVATTNQPPILHAVADPGRAALAAPITPQLTPVRDGYLTAHFAVDFATPTRLIFHTFFWPAWRLAVDGHALSSFPVTNLGLLAVDVPAGQHLLTRRWQPTAAAITGWLITGLTWGLLLLLVLSARHSRRQLVSGWLLLGLLPVVGLLWPPQTVAPTVIGAAFGAPPTGPVEVRLEAVSAAPVRVGTPASVDLYWFIVDPQRPLTAFVHLLGADGQVVAQHDGPLAGDYTPFERWLPGLVVKRQHLVPLPADLPPGLYDLMAGVYLASDANTVLMPLRVDSQPGEQGSHRIRIGKIEVIPE